MADIRVPNQKELNWLTRRAVAEIVPEAELVKALKSGRHLRIKMGFDPTKPLITMGWAVGLRKLRQFQDLGHTAVLILGDFTAQVGDPSGRSATRPRLTKEQVDEHAATYVEQIQQILTPERLEVRRNSEWLATMGIEDVLRLSARTTVARMLERDDFAKRYKSNQPIAVHEFLYPLVQGYDSVALKADVELGGTDQKFNLLVGRELQRDFGQEPQCILTLPLLVGTDGVEKMSKSLGNYIGITEPAPEIFGKLMRISDELMWQYLELLSFEPLERIRAKRKAVAEGANPRDVKFAFATEIVARFHGRSAAEAAAQDFNSRFRDRALPTDIPEQSLKAPSGGLACAQVLKRAGLASSTSEAERLIAQGGVKVNGERLADRRKVLAAGETYLVQVGKLKVARIRIT